MVYYEKLFDLLVRLSPHWLGTQEALKSSSGKALSSVVRDSGGLLCFFLKIVIISHLLE